MELTSCSGPAQGRYRVQSTLGVGGMGAVYAAFDSVRNEEVALKRLLVEKFSASGELPRIKALFEREYFTLAELSHPHVIAVYDYGVDEQGPFYTMERLRGESLRARGQIAFPLACSVLRDIASALSLVHSRRLVHRDVTFLNIHCGTESSVKLIDFGALMPMGVPKHVLGTAPFVAPECLRLEPLDGRTDLFSLGACLYFALTGKHAYPARRLEDLPETWEHLPAAPSRYAPDVPPALDELCLSLLELEPVLRPGSAAEVFERLTSIAGLSDDEHAAVASAYLTTPSLVGREAVLMRVKASLLRAARAHGRSLLVEGAAGVGRSRLLDAAAVEARLAGLEVARADASDAGAPFGALNALMRTLEANRADAGSTTERVNPDASTSQSGGSSLTRDAIFARATELVLRAASEKPLAIVVDDAHSIDEPSLAFLATLSAHTKGNKLCLITSLEHEALSRSSPAIRLLLRESKRIHLDALGAVHARALLSSLFGEVPGLDVLSTIATKRSAGRPRELMAAASLLVKKGHVRFARGSWNVPSDPELIEAQIGLSADVIARKPLEMLSQDAAELLAIAALDRDMQLTFADYTGVTRHGDPGRMHRALDEIIANGLASLTEERRLFVEPEQRKHVTARIDASQKRDIHRGLAFAVKNAEKPVIYQAHHFLKADLVADATAAIDAFRDLAQAKPEADFLAQPIALDTLEAFRMLPEGRVNTASSADHGAGFVINAIYQGMPERAVPHIPPMMRALAWFTGLDEAPRLAELDPMTRLMRIMQLGQTRCEEAGIAEFTPVSATRRLSQLSVTTAACARFMADPSLLEALVDLSPCAVLSPAIGIVSRIASAIGKVVHGRDWEAWDEFLAVYETLKGDAADNIDPLTRFALSGVALGNLCFLEAEYATSSATTLIEEYARNMPNLAESARARHRLALGDLQGARAARSRFEILSVQRSASADARATELPAYLRLYALSDDIMGLKWTLSAMQEIVRTRPLWAPRVVLANAHIERCRGETQKSLATVSELLDSIGPGHGEWGAAAALHLELLNRLSRFADARLKSEEYLAAAREHGVPTPRIELALALAAAHSSDTESAEAHFQAAHEALLARGVSGIHLGYCYEVGARIAKLRGQAPEAAERARRCEELYGSGGNSRLALRSQDLRKVEADTETAPNADDDGFPPNDRAGTTSTARLLRRLSVALNQSSDGDTRLHHYVLSILVQEAGALGGVLYLSSHEGLRRVHASAGIDWPEQLDSAVTSYHASQVFVAATCVGTAPLTAASEARFLPSTADCELVPRLLECFREGTHVVAGVLVLAVAPGDSLSYSPSTLSAAAAALANSTRRAQSATMA